jgi:ribosomal protein L11 methylase PrmA
LLVLSGILVEQRDRVFSAYSSMSLEEAPESGEWIGLLVRGSRP